MSERWQIRPARPDDLGMILQTWLRGYAVAPGRGPSECYYQAQRLIIASCMEHGRVVVAEPVGTDAHGKTPILGWACGESPGVLHFAYVKRIYRRLGMGSELARRAAGGEVETATHTAAAWQKRLLRERGIRRLERWPIYRAMMESSSSRSDVAGRPSQ